ncbi:MAG: hypothetical protein KGI50_00805 [Patescibacteria group bacterium]|nr:hypothetical protein [Patescibacteria group bacterium]MDE2438107.1 hypothetical protein [Patescibacteria group bacterium]
MHSSFSHHYERGSLFLETVIALSIFMVGFGSVLALNARSLHSVSEVSNRLVAAELAQEGVEIVRNAVLTNVLNASSTNSTFNTNLPDGYYDVYSDASGPHMSAGCPAHDCVPSQLFLSSSGYSYDGAGKPTVFRRIVHITTPTTPSVNELQVNSLVTWDGTDPFSPGACAVSQGNCLNVEDHLYNWQS